MKIRVGSSMTLNIGNFESIRPMVEIEDEVMPNEQPNQAYARITQYAEKLMQAEITHQVNLVNQARLKVQPLINNVNNSSHA